MIEIRVKRINVQFFKFYFFGKLWFFISIGFLFGKMVFVNVDYKVKGREGFDSVWSSKVL